MTLPAVLCPQCYFLATVSISMWPVVRPVGNQSWTTNGSSLDLKFPSEACPVYSKPGDDTRSLRV
jgi:hypothetical protein